MRVASLAACLLLMTSVQAWAGELSPSKAGDLTPYGAIRAGNEAGTIPAWSGGITEPPPDYVPGEQHVDPYASDQPLYTVSQDNMADHLNVLTAGHKALLKQYGKSFRMPVYPTRRSFSAPERVYDAAIANHDSAELTPDGNGVTGASETVPFPVPANGVEAIWNHLLRYRADQVHRLVGQANPMRDGSFTMIEIREKIMFPYNRVGGTDGNVASYFIQEVIAPARLAGEILLVHETINQISQARQAWTYNPGQRRVRRAPNVAYDNPGTATDGLRTSDNFEMFNGATDRYEWELVGRKELLVPYNAYQLHQPLGSFSDVIHPQHLNPDFLRYELHRVWVVEARLKTNVSNIYQRRTFYLDEDSWQILAVDLYDSRGEIWRVAEAHCINYYDVPTFWQTLDVFYDLQSGRYSAYGFDNNSAPYDFETALDVGSFSPEAIRRMGN